MLFYIHFYFCQKTTSFLDILDLNGEFSKKVILHFLSEFHNNYIFILTGRDEKKNLYNVYKYT